MRITIDLEGIEPAVTQTAAPPSVAATTSYGPTPGTAPGQPTPPPEVAAAAQALGAHDAGPAPDFSGMTSGMAPLPFMSMGPSAPMASAGDMSAGAAPNELVPAAVAPDDVANGNNPN
jgi:hypothetical protein